MKRLLIVEDDGGLSAGLCRALGNEETVTVAAENLSTAKKLLAEEEFSLVLLDVNLPDGNGFDFLPYIKQEYEIPVISRTGSL